MSEPYKSSSAIILNLAPQFDFDRFEDRFHDLANGWGFSYCKIDGIIALPDNKVRISYQYSGHANKDFAIEEVKDFAEACGASAPDRSYGITH